MVNQDPIFAELSTKERNVLKWAALLHDIAKLSIPTIEGKDHVHPFKSGAVTLKLFLNLGLIPNPTDEKRKQLL
jgi:hypothetical protein